MELSKSKSSTEQSNSPTFLDQLKKKRRIRKILVAGSGAVGKTSLVRVLKERKTLNEILEEGLEYHRTLFIDLEVVSASSLVN